MALKASITKNSRESKFKRLAGALAVNIAKQKNDPDVAKLLKYKKLYFGFKAKLNNKYASRGAQEARKSMM